MRSLSRDKRSRRHARNRMRYSLIRIAVVGSRLASNSLTPINPSQILPACMIGRTISLTRPQWKPGHTRPVISCLQAPCPATNKSNHGWRIDCRSARRARHPGPSIVQINPSPIVAGCKPPGFRIHPGPAPWRHPDPMSLLIRNPVPRDMRGHPNQAEIGILLPISIVIEFVRPRHLR